MAERLTGARFITTYMQLGPKLLYAWAALDTHDALTDRYKLKRTAEEIRECLTRCGMEAVEAYYGGNCVEGGARKPARVMPRNRGYGSTPDQAEGCNRPAPLALQSDKDRTIDKTWILGFRSAPTTAEPADGIAR